MGEHLIRILPILFYSVHRLNEIAHMSPSNLKQDNTTFSEKEVIKSAFKNSSFMNEKGAKSHFYKHFLPLFLPFWRAFSTWLLPPCLPFP
jgi:hypothetical protein